MVQQKKKGSVCFFFKEKERERGQAGQGGHYLPSSHGSAKKREAYTFFYKKKRKGKGGQAREGTATPLPVSMVSKK